MGTLLAPHCTALCSIIGASYNTGSINLVCSIVLQYNCSNVIDTIIIIIVRPLCCIVL